jgi:hypothetical protein
MTILMNQASSTCKYIMFICSSQFSVLIVFAVLRSCCQVASVRCIRRMTLVALCLETASLHLLLLIIDTCLARTAFHL